MSFINKIKDTLHRKPLLIIVTAALFSFTHLCSAAAETAASTDTGTGTSTATSTATTSSVKKEEIKNIDAKAVETKETLKQITQEVDKGKLEAERAIRERFELEKEAKFVEQEALLAKQEAESLKKQAIAQKDPEVLIQAQEVEQKAKELEKMADVKKDKLNVAEGKAQLVQDRLAANEQVIEKLQSELQILRKVKFSNLTLADKLLKVGSIIGIGLLILILFHIFVRRLKLSALKKSQKLLAKGIVRESEMTLRTRTMGSLFAWIGYLAIFSATAYLTLDYLGFDVAPLLAGAGIIGLAFGFGGQYLIRDIISGIFILLEGQVRINDVVKIGEYGGLVEDINLRITTLRDLEGRVIVVPNGEIKTLVNYTKEFAFALLNIGVAYKEKVDKVIDVIKEVGAEMRKDPYFRRLIIEDLEMLGVDEFADSQVTIKFRIKTLPIKQWEVAREYRRRIKNRFDELGIEIPFPHRTLYWGTGEDNRWVREIMEARQAQI